MIFIFLCRDPACCRRHAIDSFIVLRSQLELINDFYPETPPDEDYFDMSSDYPKASCHTQLCVVCGCAGPKLCGKCHKMSYCSKEHQTSHWKAGHRSACGHTPQGPYKCNCKFILGLVTSQPHQQQDCFVDFFRFFLYIALNFSCGYMLGT